MLANRKLFIGLLILTAFVGAGVFGMLSFSHAAEMPMADCPYAIDSYSVCESNLNHIAGWQEFSNVVLPLIFILLVLAGVSHFLGRDLFGTKRHFYRRKDSDLKKYFHTEAILKWLSLFENSPSLAYLRHS